MTEKAPERVRDAERTREAILAGAEELFARLGFDAASLYQIAVAAGVARATPAYFFGSKEALYDAVLARVVTRAQETMTRAYTESDQAASPEDAVESYVGAWLAFLSSDLNFLRLMQREALGDGSRITEFFGSAIAEGLAAVEPAAEKAGIAPERLILDLTALCWYPFAHEHTLLPVLGMKPREPEFLDEQKQHIGDIVRAMTGKAEAPS